MRHGALIALLLALTGCGDTADEGEVRPTPAASPDRSSALPEPEDTTTEDDAGAGSTMAPDASIEDVARVVGCRLAGDPRSADAAGALEHACARSGLRIVEWPDDLSREQIAQHLGDTPHLFATDVITPTGSEDELRRAELALGG